MQNLMMLIGCFHLHIDFLLFFTLFLVIEKNEAFLAFRVDENLFCKFEWLFQVAKKSCNNFVGNLLAILPWVSTLI